MTNGDVAGRGGGEGPRVRDHLANTRTMLAWMRVAMALLTIGYSLDRLGLLQARGHAGAASPYRAYGIGSAAAGTLLAALALARYLRQRGLVEGAALRSDVRADVAMVAVAGAVGAALVLVLAVTR